MSPNRMDVRTTAGGVVLIDDCYNANPDATRAALGPLAAAAGRARQQQAVVGFQGVFHGARAVSAEVVGGHFFEGLGLIASALLQSAHLSLSVVGCQTTWADCVNARMECQGKNHALSENPR